MTLVLSIPQDLGWPLLHFPLIISCSKLVVASASRKYQRLCGLIEVISIHSKHKILIFAFELLSWAQLGLFPSHSLCT